MADRLLTVRVSCRGGFGSIRFPEGDAEYSIMSGNAGYKPQTTRFSHAVDGEPPGICRIVLRAKNDLVITNVVSIVLLERARVRGSRIKMIHVVGT